MAVTEYVVAVLLSTLWPMLYLLTWIFFRRGFFRKVLCGARKLVQGLESARQQHPYQVAALGIVAGVALATTISSQCHHKDRSTKENKYV